MASASGISALCLRAGGSSRLAGLASAGRGSFGRASGFSGIARWVSATPVAGSQPLQLQRQQQQQQQAGSRASACRLSSARPALFAGNSSGSLLSASCQFLQPQPQQQPARQFCSPKEWTNDSVPLERRRNIAIIAHVDHGKTTMVDCLLRQSNIQLGKESSTERVMDSNALEQERGITILSKCTSLLWTPNGEDTPYLFNIVDTPGHADFGGEVERIMSMVDGVALVVCASEGPMPQTKYVLGKALKAGLKPLVIINKIDRPGARATEVEGEIFDLFADLGATEEQIDFATLYASGKNGWCNTEPEPRTEGQHDANAFFETAVDRVKPPTVTQEQLDMPFQMLVTQVDSHPHFGRILIGRVNTGHVRVGDMIHALDSEGKVQESNCRVLRLLSRRGMETSTLNETRAGDICMIAAGFQAATVNSTLGLPSVKEALPSHPVDPPTLSVMVGPNTSPMVGQDGKGSTSLEIKSYLKQEAEINVSIQVFDHGGDSIELRGRGELQIGVVVETMRRLGMELSLSPPKVVYKRPKPGQDLSLPASELEMETVMDPTGKDHLYEPLEEVVVDINQGDSGLVMEKLSMRKGEVINYVNDEGSGRTRMTFLIPTRCLLGYQSEFQSDTKGQGIIYNTFHSFVEYQGALAKQIKGALVSKAPGKITAHALESLQTRGTLFVQPGDETYEGMVIGESSKDESLDVNPVRAKQLTNIRTTSREGITRLTPPVLMSLEQMLVYCRPDEMIEVTPKAVRLRKVLLSESERKQRRGK